MLIGVNSLHQIKEIHNINDVSLTTVELDENAPNFPFTNWRDTRILCYCYKQTDQGISIYPYIDTNIIEKLEQQEEERVKLQTIIDTMLTGGVTE